MGRTILFFLAVLRSLPSAMAAIAAQDHAALGLRRAPIIHAETRHTYGAAWLSSMPTLLRAARMMGDPDEIVTDLEGGTWKFVWKLPECGGRLPVKSETATRAEGWRPTCPHARDVLDFVSVHLGTMYRLASERRHVDNAAAVVRFFEDRATREARRRTADDARSRDASLGLVSVCFDCSLDEPRGHRKTVEGMRLELEFVRAAVASLRSTCGAVVAGVMRAVAANETEWARAAGFDGVFVVDHHDIWHPPANATGLGKRYPTSKRIYRPNRQHPVQTWLRFANAVRDLRDRGLGDADAIEWFGAVLNPNRFKIAST